MMFDHLKHIEEILGAVGAHISSLLSPVLGTSAKNVEKNSEKFRKRRNTSEHFQT